MKCTTDQALSEILRRSGRITERRNRRAFRIYATASGVLLAASIALITLLPGWTKTEAERTFFGAFLLPSEAGGYVLAGVLAFALGVAVTILCLYLRKRSERRDNLPEEKEEETG